jgi:peptidyl-tRNA hydrolase, PTH1 family
LKYLIAGLGNIGDEYAGTRHNIGFTILDALARASNISFSPDKLAFRSELRFKGRPFVLVKPSTYMNLSGKAVNYWLQQEKVPVENLLVILDDIALPFGVLRLKAKGSDGGHNGLKSIDEALRTQNYARLRFGIGSDFSKGRQSDGPRVELAIEAVKSFGTIGINLTMTNFNNK